MGMTEDMGAAYTGHLQARADTVTKLLRAALDEVEAMRTLETLPGAKARSDGESFARVLRDETIPAAERFRAALDPSAKEPEKPKAGANGKGEAVTESVDSEHLGRVLARRKEMATEPETADAEGGE